MDAQYLNLPCDPETQEARLYCTACPPNRRTREYTPSPSNFRQPYFFTSLLSASFTAVSSASAAFTLTSGSTPITAQSGCE